MARTAEHCADRMQLCYAWKSDRVYIRHSKMHGDSPCKSAARCGLSFLFPIYVRYHKHQSLEAWQHAKHSFCPSQKWEPDNAHHIAMTVYPCQPETIRDPVSTIGGACPHDAPLTCGTSLGLSIRMSPPSRPRSWTSPFRYLACTALVRHRLRRRPREPQEHIAACPQPL